MNDPTTLAATEYEEPRRLPDTTDVWPSAGDTDDLDFGPDARAQVQAQAPSLPQAQVQAQAPSLPQAQAQALPQALPQAPASAQAPAPPLADAEPESEPVPAPDPAPRNPSQDGAASVHTVLETAATGRSVREVAALVSLLKESGQVPNPGHTALRAAAVSRPLHEVREMVTLLSEPPHELAETDITLRAAALGRPIEDVAQLVSILGSDAEPPYRRPEPAAQAPAAAHHPGPAPAQAPDRGPAGSPRSVRPAPSAGRGSGALRHILRWPVAFALLLCGALHVPGDLAGLTSGDPDGLLALGVTLLCLTAGALLAVRDTAGAWRAAAVVALGVAALHVVGGVVGFDPLGGAVGGSVEWAGITAVLSAAAGAVLAGLALQYRSSAGPADGA